MERQYLDDLALFIAIAEAGSFNKAADELGIAKATLSRRIQHLEQKLDCHLLRRNSRGIHLTAQGEHYLNRCGPLLKELQQTHSKLSEDRHQLKGRITVLAPTNLANYYLRDKLLAFMALYPEIQLVVKLSNYNVDLFNTEFDLAFRVGSLDDSRMICRQIGQTHMQLCASPAYIAQQGEPENPDELRDHQLLALELMRNWEFIHCRTGEQRFLRGEPRLRVDDAALLLAAAEQGLGIGYLPGPMVKEAINDGRLVPLLEQWKAKRRELNIIWPNRDFMPARVRVFYEFMVEKCQQDPFSSTGTKPCKSG